MAREFRSRRRGWSELSYKGPRRVGAYLLLPRLRWFRSLAAAPLPASAQDQQGQSRKGAVTAAAAVVRELNQQQSQYGRAHRSSMLWHRNRRIDGSMRSDHERAVPRKQSEPQRRGRSRRMQTTWDPKRQGVDVSPAGALAMMNEKPGSDQLWPGLLPSPTTCTMISVRTQAETTGV